MHGCAINVYIYAPVDVFFFCFSLTLACSLSHTHALSLASTLSLSLSLALSRSEDTPPWTFRKDYAPADAFDAANENLKGFSGFFLPFSLAARSLYM